MGDFVKVGADHRVNTLGLARACSGMLRSGKPGYGMGNKTEGAQMTIKLKIKSDGLCALLRHQWKRHPDKLDVEFCEYCGKTRKVKNEVAKA